MHEIAISKNEMVISWQVVGGDFGFYK